MSGLPIHGARIHRPQLRDDVLSRERLNGWLDQAATGRVALIVAEAGYGKTTLLADWSRHTRRRTIWYRLEPDDRDWLTFLRHLVGSGIEVEPSFAPETLRLLNDVGPGGPTQAQIVDSLLRELSDAAASDPFGFTLIFDDYHHIDGCEETDPIVRGIVERTGPGLSMVLATRSTPKLPLGRLRARGGLARLDGDALCFDHDETDRLFREAYRHPLDADVIADLLARTEGWAALLSLVRTSIEERAEPNVRLLTQQLSGGRGDIYDYLAEDVVGGLPDRLQRFLMRVSILEAVEPQAARVADPDVGDDCERLIKQAEDLRLLARPDGASAHAFHPLVRDFLVTRLTAEVGPDEIRERHLMVARRFEGSDWRIAAAHFSFAGDAEAVERVLDRSLEQVLASGRFEEARRFIPSREPGDDWPVSLILRSRLELGRGNLERSSALAARAVASAGRSPHHTGVALLNLASVMGVSGFPDDAVVYAQQALNFDLTASQRDVAEATIAMSQAARDGDLVSVADRLSDLAIRQEADGHRHYMAVTRLNLAAVLYWTGDTQQSLAQASLAELALAEVGGDGVELVSATVARALALAHLGRFGEAERALNSALASQSPHGRQEALLEAARVLVHFGGLKEATASLEAAAHAVEASAGLAAIWALITGELALRRADLTTARLMIERLVSNPCIDIAGRLRTEILVARVAVLSGAPTRSHAARAVVELAVIQRSKLGRLVGDVLAALAGGDPVVGAPITQLSPGESAALSLVAEEIAANLHRLSPEAARIVLEECLLRPARWTSALRACAQAPGPSRLPAAALLAQVGTNEEIEVLRAVAADHRAARAHAVELARRVAPAVVVQDLGPVTIWVGPNLAVRALRRKVLGLLCFLLSRPSMAATRDEALDALWPDLSPDTATNSLNQTIYFLRRVFEPDYKEGFSAGYVRFDGDMVSLEAGLIDSASRRCRRLLSRTDRRAADTARELSEIYVGRFALDFSYEEWASDHRESLHAAVLAFIEHAVQEAMARRDYETAITLAQRMLGVDPDADSLELLLLRAYRASGRHAAAAEQYAHYASVQRDQLGVEPPRLEDL